MFAPIIEVIIGLVFVYSLLSILVTQINAVIVNVLNLRARHLKKAVAQLLMDPATQARFMTHPLIGLVRRPLRPDRPLSAQGAEQVMESSTSDVDWIDPTIFANVVIEIVSGQAGANDDLYGPVLRVANTVLEGQEKARVRAAVRNIQSRHGSLDELYSVIVNLQDPADRQAMLQALNDVEMAQDEFGTDSPELVKLLRGLRQIDSPELQRALDTVLATARNIDQARQRIEAWFDKSMQQVTDAYRRRLQWISVLVGLGLALVLNVDSLQLAQSLWNDPAVRETVVAAARTSLETGDLASRIELVVPETTLQSGATGPEATPEPAVTDQDIEEAQRRLNESAARTAETVDDLLQLRLPIGWWFQPATAESSNLFEPEPLLDTRNLWNYFPGNNPANWFGLVLRKLIGLAITTIAISQGAPFWFDLLNRIARGRN